jgi:hypothetical protein
MNPQIDRVAALTALLAQSRNGMNQAIRHNPFTPRFLISDGVRDLADLTGGCWLLDILATELEPKLLADINKGKATTCLVELEVTGSKAIIRATLSDDGPPYWQKDISYTDFPEGKWMLFEIGALEWDMDTEQARNVIAILLSEH